MEAGGTAEELIKLSDTSSPYANLESFDIDRKIGKGQFSVVYRAKALHNQTIVALKKVQIFEMMDSKVFHIINIFIVSIIYLGRISIIMLLKSGTTRLYEGDPVVAAA